MPQRIHGRRICIGVTNRDVIESSVVSTSRIDPSLMPRYHDSVGGPAGAAELRSGAAAESTIRSVVIQVQNRPRSFLAVAHDQQAPGPLGGSWTLSGQVSDRDVAVLNRKRMPLWRWDCVSDGPTAQEKVPERGPSASGPSSFGSSALDDTIWPPTVGSPATTCSQAAGRRSQALTPVPAPQVLAAQQMCPRRVACPSERHRHYIEAERPPCVDPLDTDADPRNRCGEHIASAAVSRS